MNKSQIFKAAHAKAKAIVSIVGDYMVAFSYSLKEVYSKMNNNMKQKLESLGMTVWGEEHGKARMYANDDSQFAAIFGLEIHRYGTGNISSASLRGEKISNGKAKKILSNRVYFDLQLNKFIGCDLEPII